MENSRLEIESISSEEESVIEKLRALLTAGQRANPATAKGRGQHTKGHGCVWADFTIEKDLPSSLRTSVFVPGKRYDALLRFSNGRVADDTQRDAHGLAIKLLGLEGPRAMAESELATQDFVMADSPAFFAIDAKHMLDFVIGTAPEAAGGGGKTAAELAATTHPKVATFTKHALPSPLEMSYWSQTPYLAGVSVVKYYAAPIVKSENEPKTSGDKDFLRTAMVEALRGKDVSFEFFAQLRQDRDSVEDATEEWPSEMIKVATIRINSQGFTSKEQMDFCENLVFSPWNAHQEHRPLGSINRARKGIYLDSRKLREAATAAFTEPNISDRERLAIAED